jgi:ATP-dependent Lhr-like helicase
MPLEGLGLDWAVEMRTGDTSASTKKRQKTQLPQGLVTTPESLTLMLSYEGWEEAFSSLKCVVVDEWHELMSSKRGVQTELALARLRTASPATRIWGVSATLGNLPEALETLVGIGSEAAKNAVMIQGDIAKEIIIDSLIPEEVERFSWAGHVGKQMVPRVVDEIEAGGTCLIFTNVRSQAEIWYQAILELRPDWVDIIGLHHGSLDRDVRDQVELGLKEGTLRAVVCTSSLDLGVDFTPVDHVIQLGSPKGVARLLQRAGRSGHRPGVPSKITCVPTHALELIDIAAAREGAIRGEIESREGVDRPLDVLVQHVVTCALAGGFDSHQLLDEVRTTKAYRHLSAEEWEWTLDFVTRGGESLRAYDQFKRVKEIDGRYVVPDAQIARRHRMSIGTITSDAAVAVQYLKGNRLGTVEESFIARLKPGDKFLFAGKPLTFVRMKEMTAWVRRASSFQGAIPRWMGGRLPLTTELSHSIRRTLSAARNGELISQEMHAMAPLLEVQSRWSAIPEEDEILIERVKTREGYHIFFYPFEGRLVHEGLAAVLAYRMSRMVPITFSMAYNDYGIELLSPEPAPLEEALDLGLFSPQNLAEDILNSLNEIELSRRQFREIARIAGLVFEGFPWMRKTARQIQGSAGLFYDVFRRYEPNNLLVQQATREVLDRQLEQTRLSRALERLSFSRLLITEPPRPTPLAFPILVDRLRDQVTSEALPDRIEKMSLVLEREADR